MQKDSAENVLDGLPNEYTLAHYELFSCIIVLNLPLKKNL